MLDINNQQGVGYSASVTELTIENAALKQEIERLKEIDERECLISIALKKDRDKWLRVAGENGKFYMEALEENNKLVKALEWYGDEVNYRTHGGVLLHSDVQHDEGSLARRILHEIKGREEQ